MKRKGLFGAVTLLFLFCLVATAAGQMIPGQPSGSGQPNIPVLPGTPDFTGASAPLSLPSGQRYEIKPYIFATEQYTSNVFLTNTNQKSDWITTLGPGIRLAVNDPSFGANLTGNFGYNWYANQTKNDYWSIDGNLGLRYNPTPQLTFRVTNYTLRSQNSVEPNFPQGGQPAQPGNIVGTNQSNTPYLRNVVEPSVDWQFSKQGSVGILYRNNILINDDSDIYQNSMENTVRPYISYWFDQRNNLALDYSFTDGTYSGGPGGVHSPDFTTQNPHGRYTYRFDAQMSVFADYAYVNQINDSPGINYNVNSPSLGIVYNFNPTLTATVQAGWFWMDPERNKAQDGLISNVSITQRDGQTTYTLAFNSGYQQNLFSFDTQGFFKYYGGSAVISHNVTQRFRVGAIGTAQYTEYAFVPRNDWIYTADATASYQILQWLTVGGRAGYQQNDSNIAVYSYDEWHAFLTLTATFDNLLK